MVLPLLHGKSKAAGWGYTHPRISRQMLSLLNDISDLGRKVQVLEEARGQPWTWAWV